MKNHCRPEREKEKGPAGHGGRLEGLSGKGRTMGGSAIGRDTFIGFVKVAIGELEGE